MKPDYLIRAEEELTQLNERIEKLDAFLTSTGFTQIDPLSQDDLKVQILGMRTYQVALDRRVKRLNKEFINQNRPTHID
jgi:hypothetical protein